MPVINIKVRERLTKRQKEIIAKKISEVISKTVGKTKEKSHDLEFNDDVEEIGNACRQASLARGAVSLQESLYFFARD